MGIMSYLGGDLHSLSTFLVVKMDQKVVLCLVYINESCICTNTTNGPVLICMSEMSECSCCVSFSRSHTNINQLDVVKSHGIY